MIGLDEIRKKGIEHLQKYETAIGELLRYDVFTKADIYRCGVSKPFVGKLIHRLVKEGTLQEAIRLGESEGQDPVSGRVAGSFGGTSSTEAAAGIGTSRGRKRL